MDLTLTGKTKVISPTAANLYPGRYGWLSLEFAEPNLGSPPPGTLLALLTSDQFGNRGWTDYSLTQPFSSLERPDLTDVDSALEWLLYKYPNFATFTVQTSSNYLIEMGTGQTVTLTWSSVKVDPRAIFNFTLSTSSSEILDYRQLGTGNHTFSSFVINVPISNVPALTTFRVIGTDWAGVTAEALASYKFVGRIFIGSLPSSTALSPLCSEIVSNAQFTFLSDKITFNNSVNCTPQLPLSESRRFYVAYPASLGSIPQTIINGFNYSWQFALSYPTFTYTPLGGPLPVVIPYIIYISNNEHNGPIPLKIG